ncbi:MAG: glycosyltransferase [Desulfovibrio sp.]
MKTIPVSVLIPAYKPDFIAAALKSVLDQSVQPEEIIISDDCPTDCVRKALRPLLEANPQIQYKKNTPSLGLAANYLKLSELATQPWLKYLDDDDLLEKEALESYYEATIAHPTASIVMSAMRHFYEDGVEKFDTHSLPAITKGKEYYLELYNKNAITLFTRLLVKAEVCQAVRSMNVPARIISLDELVGQIACLMGDFAYLEPVLCHHRQHSAGYSGNTDLQVLCDDLAYVLLPAKYAQATNAIPEERLAQHKEKQLVKVIRGTLTKLLKHDSREKAEAFLAHARTIHPQAAKTAMLSPRIAKRWVFSFFK